MNRLPHWARFENTRAILIFFVGLTSFAIISQTGWTIIQDHDLTLISEQENGLIAARLLEEHAQQQLKVAADGLDLIAARIQEVEQRQALDDNAIHDVIEGAIKNSLTVGAQQFVNPAGVQWVSTFDFPHFIAVGEKRDYIPWLLAHRNYRKIYIGVPFHRYIDGEQVLPMARNLYDKRGRYLGLISTEVIVAYFSAAYARVAKDNKAIVQLLSDSGAVIVSSIKSEHRNTQATPSTLVLLKQSENLTEGTFEAPSPFGNHRLYQYSYRKVRGFSVTTVFGREVATILLHWRARTWDRILFSSVFILFHLLLTWYLLLHMTRLKQSELQLRASESRLEQRVAERTENLQNALNSLTNMQSELVRSEKMAAIGMMVAGVAHELNTPIGNSLTTSTSIQFYAETMQQELREERPRRSILAQKLSLIIAGEEIVANNLQRAATLVASFKQISGDQYNDQCRTFDLSQLLNQIVPPLVPTTQKTIVLELDLATDITLQSNPDTLAKVMENLVSNALLHGFDGREQGVIRLTTKSIDEQHIEIVFSDNGVGISSENMGRIFDPFFTTKLGHGGSGLGMHVVYNRVTQVLNGRIFLQSTPGTGTKVTIILPKKRDG
jgi:signal transduction histidine kinase